MKILHTSDWHIGRTFHGVDLLEDQRAVLDAMAKITADREIDVVLISGDVYDRAVPSADAVRLCNDAFEKLHAAGATIIATPGNHDSAPRLGAGAAFSGAGGLYLKTTVAGVDAPVVLADAHGDVAFYGLPYLEPEAVKAELGVFEARSHQDVLSAAMYRVRADVERRQPGLRSVVLAHAFVVGAVASESERPITVGGVETVPASIFGGVDYVALGHLHTPQVVNETIRYSGSPLPYSFGERDHRKSVWLIELNDAGVESIEKIDLPVVRGLSEITGPLDELLGSEVYANCLDDYVSAILTDPVRPVDAMRKLQERFPHAVHLRWERPTERVALRYAERLRGQSDLDIARRFFEDAWTDPDEEHLRLVEQALAAGDSRERRASA
ncbi:exonuclease SbcCD subunit D [Hoyosella altamirensis]|uniref:Nuclease SbcCD subunit D n=1 Tax=Hoyosella altamirensis TaxID=616997 RepID=A0A839RI12_9ACTN|nr:exonuclease SbcCD subunit D [Hoyosella altamirensis]MBB3036050.1 exonuclease SbcD [Hoyosella altamirensis]